jgi:hypothetical protein
MRHTTTASVSLMRRSRTSALHIQHLDVTAELAGGGQCRCRFWTWRVKNVAREPDFHGPGARSFALGLGIQTVSDVLAVVRLAAVTAGGDSATRRSDALGAQSFERPE